MIPYPITITPPVYRGLRKNISSLVIEVPFAWEDYTTTWDELYIWWNMSYMKVTTAQDGTLILPISGE